MAVLDWTGILVRGFRGEIERALTAQVGQPVTMRKVTGGIWGRIVLHDVKTVLSNHMAVHIDRTVIRLHFWTLIKNRSHPEIAIRHVTLNHFEAALQQAGLRVIAEEVMVEILPDHTEVSWAVGTVLHPLVGKYSLEGHFGIRGQHATLDRMKIFNATSMWEAHGTMKKGAKSVIDAVYTDLMKHQTFPLSIHWDDQVAKVSTKHPSGDFALDAQMIFGSAPPTPQVPGVPQGSRSPEGTPRVAGRLTSQFRAQLKGSKVESWLGFSRLEARGSWDTKSIRLASLTGEQGSRRVLSGWLVAPLQETESPEGLMKGEEMELARLPFMNALGQEGRLSVSVALGGTREEPVVKVSAAVNSVADSASVLKGANVQAEIGRDALRIRKMALADGRVRVSGVVRNPWASGGARNGEGVVWVKRWAAPWMDLRETAVAWKLEQDHLTWLESKVLTAHGAFRLKGDLQWNGEPSGSFRIATEGDQKNTPFGLAGSVKVDYRVKSAPWSLDVEAQSDIALHKKPIPPIDLSLVFREKGMTINRCSWGTYLNGTGRMEFHEKGSTEALMEVKALPLSMFNGFLDSSKAMAGAVSGTIRVHGSKPLPEVQIELAVNGGVVGAIPFGNGTVHLAKSQGEAYTVEIRSAKGSQTFSTYGTVSWSPPTPHESPADRLKIDLNWSCANQPLAEWLQVMFGREGASKVSGMLAGRGRAYGSVDHPTVQGNVTLQNGRAFGNAFEVISGTVDASRQEVNITEAKWQSDLDQVAIRGVRVGWQEGRTTWECDDIRLEPFNLWAFRLTGSLALTGQVSKDGAWTTRVESQDLSMNGYPYGLISWQAGFHPREEEYRVDEIGETGTHVAIRVHQDEVTIRPSTVRLPKGSLAAQGRVSPQALSVTLKGQGVDTAFIMRALAIAVDGEGPADFDLAITGALAHPKVNGTFHIQEGRFELWPFQNFTGQLAVENQWIYLKSWVMSREGKFQVTVNGKIPILLPSKEMSLDVEIQDDALATLMPLGWFKSLEGQLRGRLHFAGTPGHPVWSGKLAVAGGMIRPKKFIEEIRETKGTFTIQRNRGVFEEFSGTVEGVPISVKGSIQFQDYDPALLDIALSTHHQAVSVNVPGIMEPDKRGMMRIGGLADEWFVIKGRRDRSLYQGKIKLQDARFTWPPKEVTVEGGTGSAGADQSDFIKDNYWDVSFEVGDRLVYFNDFATITLHPGDQLACTELGRRMNIQGALRSERGTFDYLNHSFTIVSGEAVWTGEGTAVHLSAKAETEYQGYKFTAYVKGREREKDASEELMITLESDPYLSQQSIASMLTIGMDTTAMTDDQVNEQFQHQFQGMIARSMVRYGARGMLSKLQNVTGFEFSLDPGAQDPSYHGSSLSGGLLSSWEVGVGRYLTPRWRVGVNLLNYSTIGTTTDWRQQLQMDYRVMGQDYFRTLVDREDIKFRYERRIPF